METLSDLEDLYYYYEGIYPIIALMYGDIALLYYGQELDFYVEELYREENND